MKKKILTVLLALSLTLGLSTQALAAEGTEHTYGVTNVSMNTGYSLTLQDAVGTTASSYTGVVDEATKTVYDGVVKMELTFTGDADSQYLVFLLEDSEVPSENSLRYINQTTGSGEVSFTIYPDTLESAGTYDICLSSTDEEFAIVGTFEVVDSWEEAGYLLGDVDMDGSVSSQDAAVILSYNVGNMSLTDTQLAAGKVYNGIDLTAADAALILQKASGVISSFPIES